jgi:regulator of sigma E protease
MTRLRPYLTSIAFVMVAIAALASPTARPMALTLVVLLALIGLHEFGHLLAARACGVGTSEFSIGFGPLVGGTKQRPGRTRFVLRAIPLGGYVRIKGMAETGAETDDAEVPGKAYSEVSAVRQVIISAAGPVANLVVALGVFIVLFAAIGVAIPTTSVQPIADGPAATAGMLDGDRVVSVAGNPIGEWEDIGSAIATAGSSDVDVVVERGGELVTVPVQAEVDGERLIIGITPVTTQERLGPVDATVAGATVTWRVITGSAAALARIPEMVVGLPAQFAGTAADPNARFVSPIGMAGVAEQSMAQDGLPGVLVLVGLVSVFLALFNLLPVPPLDGGHIIVSTYEGVGSRLMGRAVRVSRVVISRVTLAVAGVLLVIGVASIVLDLMRPIVLP